MKTNARFFLAFLASIELCCLFGLLYAFYFIGNYKSVFIFIALAYIVLFMSLDAYGKIISSAGLIELTGKKNAPEVGGQGYAATAESAVPPACGAPEAEKSKISGEREENKVLDARLNEPSAELSALKEKLHLALVEAVQARQAAADSQAKLKALAESTFDVFCETDIGGNYLYISPNNEKLLGFKPEDFIGKNFSEFVHPEDLPAAFNAFQNGLQGLRAEATLRFRHRDGHYIWIESTGACYQTVSGDLRAIIVSRDITARRRLEEEAVRAEKLDALNKMACGIAHDFNNIITCLSGNVVLLKKSVGDPARFEEIIARIEKNVRRASELTNELAVDSSGGSIEPSPVDVNALLKRIVAENPYLADGGFNVKAELKEGLWPVWGDERQLARAFAGILGNACRSAAGGVVEITTDNRIIFENDPSFMKPGRYARISFRDSRAGLDPGAVSRIFDPYYCREGQKDGLELFNAYTITKRHDGYMTAQAYAGGGVKFEMFIPAATDGRTAGRKDQGRAQTAGESKPRVLLMDDDEEILNSLMENLTEEGYFVSVSRNGNDAVEKYRTGFEKGEPFDVVVLDLIVPGGVGGAETVKMLLDLDPRVRAIVSSGYSNDPVMAEYKKFGFSAVIAKPYEIKSLCDLIDSLAAARRT